MTISLPEHLVRKAELWALYANWNDLLEQQAPVVASSMLSIKDLVYTYKDAYFKGFFWDEKKQAQAKRILEHLCSFQWSAEEIEKQLTLRQRSSREKFPSLNKFYSIQVIG